MIQSKLEAYVVDGFKRFPELYIMWIDLVVEDEPEQMEKLNQDYLDSAIVLQEDKDCHEEDSLLEESDDVVSCKILPVINF